jgi:tetratricopeptide (TPR) repeat protein
VTSQYLDQAAKKSEFDKLMTAATVHRRRGDYAQATESVRQALAILPDNLDAREFAADMINAHGDVRKASEHYKALLEIEPGRASVEAKYARAVLELAETDRQRGLVQEMLENPSKRPAVASRNPTVAALLSIAPGFGHVYCGLYLVGAALFAGWLFAWVLFFATLDSSVGISAVRKLTGPAAAFLLLAGAGHIYAIVSSAREADKTKRGRDPSEPE